MIRIFRRRKKTLFLALVGLVLLLPAAFVGAVWMAEPDCEDEGCPSLDAIEAYRPPEPPHIYDRDGTLVGHLSGPRRMVVDLEDVPAWIRDGFVAVEDRRFWQHDGVDLRGGMRALAANLTAGGIEEGASTITMQLVRNVFGEEVLEYSPWRRKLTEIAMARKVEDRLSKTEILGLYLNQIYLGDGVYGVEGAARHYFGKPVSRVTLGEAAILVGLAKNPEGYNPRRNPERARQRRDVVLDVFVREGVVDGAEAARALDEEIRVSPTPAEWGDNAYYFAAVRRELRRLVPEPRERSGIRVHTALDPGLQAAAASALRSQIEAVEAGRFGSYRHARPGSGDLEPAPDGTSPYLQGMVVALDARSGEVRAAVGGRDYGHSEFDRAFLARRQPGSSFKPILYSAALANGLRLSDLVPTTPVAIRQASGPVWEPAAGAGDEEELSVRDALALSSNAAAVRVGEAVGIGRVVRQAERLGITTPVPEYPSIFLGAAEVIPAELTAAYATFANGGVRVAAHLITRIEDPEGRVLWRAETRGTRALDPGVAFLMVDAMRDVVDRGTGWRVREAGFHGPAAGKTGTTDDAKDVWFVGMTPDLVAGVWLGFDRPRTIVSGASGGRLAAPVWGRMMREAGADRPEGAWHAPAEVVRARVDRGTGYLATDACPEEVVGEEWFLAGTEPIAQCPTHEQDLFHKILKGLQRTLGGG